MVLPLTTNHNELDYFLEICGSFLLTGGHAVSSSVYNAEQLFGVEPRSKADCEYQLE